MTIYPQFNPPQRTLMGPGPSDVYPSVLQAVSKPTLGHLDPLFVSMMDETKDMLQQAFFTQNQLTMVVSAPGSAGMGTCFANLVEPGDKVLVAVNGVFGGRMVENVERWGGIAVVENFEWGTPVLPERIEARLNSEPDIALVAVVHAETSTGVASDIKTIAEIAHRHNCLIIADTVTSFGGIELRVDDWQLDAVYSGSQKCLSCVPGLSPVTFSRAATEKIKARKTKVHSWFYDLNLVMNYWGGGSKRSYHHTAPVNTLYGMHEALRLLLNEGLEASWARHAEAHSYLKTQLNELGIQFYVDEAYRLPQLNAVLIPESIDEALVRNRLLSEYNLEIGAGLGPLAGKIWRIGLMGHGASHSNVDKLVSALRMVL